LAEADQHDYTGAVQSWLANHGLPIGVAVIVGGFVALMGIVRSPAQPPIEVRAREPLPSPTVVVYVHVDGAVRAPGVYALPSGARVFEAIEAAGGRSEDADLRELNLAARVADGQKLVIPDKVETAEAVAPPPPANVAAPASGRGAASSGPANAASARINLNTATQSILETLPGVGPVTANRIIEYRQANGPITRVEQLREARLVNASTFERIRGLVATE
jgi:competence protein ComEA